jgi:hypothetical protein
VYRQDKFTNEGHFYLLVNLIVPEKEWPMTKQCFVRDYGCEAVDGRPVFVFYTSIMSAYQNNSCEKLFVCVGGGGAKKLKFVL